MSSQDQETSGKDLAPLDQGSKMMSASPESPPVSVETGNEELSHQEPEAQEKEQTKRGILTIVSIVLEFLVLALLSGLLINIISEGIGQHIDILMILIGLIFISLSVLSLVILLLRNINITCGLQLFVLCLFVIGVALLAMGAGRATTVDDEPSPTPVMSPTLDPTGSPTPTRGESFPPVLAFEISAPRELSPEDKSTEVEGTLRLGQGVDASVLDIKVYVKPSSGTGWQLSNLDLKCAATIRNRSWRIESGCVEFDPTYDAFSVIAVLVDEEHIDELPGSSVPHRVEVAEFADLKDMLHDVVYRKDENSISPLSEVTRVLTPVPTDPTPTSSAAFTPILTNTPTPTQSEKLTSTPTPTATPTLFPSVEIDDKESQSCPDSPNNCRLLRWRLWSHEDAPENWYYVVRFLPAENPNSVFYTEKVTQDMAKEGHWDNEGWRTYRFDIYDLPDRKASCRSYWDVIVGIDAEQVNCPENRIYDGACRLTEFSEKQQYLGTAPPYEICKSGDGGASSSREGSKDDGHLPPDP